MGEIAGEMLLSTLCQNSPFLLLDNTGSRNNITLGMPNNSLISQWPIKLLQTDTVKWIQQYWDGKVIEEEEK